MTLSCDPKVLLFPTIHSGPDTYLSPLSKSQAIRELLPQGLLVHDKALAKQEFQVFSHLVKELDCYRLHLGNSIHNLPQIIDSLIA